MPEPSSTNSAILTEIRKLDDKYFDYLYSLKHLFEKEETMTFQKFINVVNENGQVTLIFKTIKGVSLRSDVKRDLNEAFGKVYKHNYQE